MASSSSRSPRILKCEEQGVAAAEVDDPAATTFNNDLLKEANSVQDDDDDQDADREGRFYGPDSSWRFYTHDIRALASSLEQTQNNDLSIHLYNTHALKTQHRLQSPNGRVVLHRAKRSWHAVAHGTSSAFYPPKGWTSWPLLPADVPRQCETWGVPTEHPHERPGTYFKPENWRPGKHLEDEVCASALRIVKDQVRRQAWGESSPRHDHPPDYSSSTDTHEPSPSDSAPGEITKPLEEQSNEEAPQGYHQQLRSKPTPSLCVDEETNARLLRPSIDHMLARVDDLLLGLHKNRQGHRVSRPRSHKIGNRPRSRYRRHNRPSTQSESPAKRRRLGTDTEAEIDNDIRVAVAEASDCDNPNTNKSGPRSNLSTRDWSEVLSIAALVGWDPEVIQRTAHRCAAIMGEGMEIRSMPEANPKHDRIARYLPDMIPPLDTSEDRSDSDTPRTSSPEVFGGRSGLADGTIVQCPESRCSRGLEPFQSRWRLREHLRRKHRYSKDEVNELVPKLERTTKAQTPIRANMATAVHEDCFLQPVVVKTSKRKMRQA